MQFQRPGESGARFCSQDTCVSIHPFSSIGACGGTHSQSSKTSIGSTPGLGQITKPSGVLPELCRMIRVILPFSSVVKMKVCLPMQKCRGISVRKLCVLLPEGERRIMVRVRPSAEREIKSRATRFPNCWSIVTDPVEAIMPEGAGEAVRMGVLNRLAIRRILEQMFMVVNVIFIYVNTCHGVKREFF